MCFSKGKGIKQLIVEWPVRLLMSVGSFILRMIVREAYVNSRIIIEDSVVTVNIFGDGVVPFLIKKVTRKNDSLIVFDLISAYEFSKSFKIHVIDSAKGIAVFEYEKAITTKVGTICRTLFLYALIVGFGLLVAISVAGISVFLQVAVSGSSNKLQNSRC